MKISFYVRNAWTRAFCARFYWFGLGYEFQGPQLLVWHLWIAGFCLCLFVDTEKSHAYPRPFPYSLTRWWTRRKYKA